MACGNLETKVSTIVYAVLMLFANGTPLLFGIAIIVFKRTDDLLQGISKLDHLIKVSIFQEYKIKQNRRDTLDIDDIQERTLRNSRGESITSDMFLDDRTSSIN